MVDKMFSFTLVKFPDSNADSLESSKVFSSVDEFESTGSPWIVLILGQNGYCNFAKTSLISD